MCDVPITAVFCSESIESFLGMACKFFFESFVTIQVAPIITGIIIHFMFHIRCISVHNLFSFTFFSPCFCMIFLTAGIDTPVTIHVFFFFFFLNYIICSICRNFSICVYLLIPQHSYLHVHILAWACMCTLYKLYINILLTENTVCMHYKDQLVRFSSGK